MAEKIYPGGIRVFKKGEKAPDFVLGTVIITLREFNEFCKANRSLLSDYKGEPQLRLNALKSQDGAFYFTVDTYSAERPASLPATALPEVSEDLPF